MRAAIVFAFALTSTASAQRVVTIRMTPTEPAQIAVWITDAEGNYLATLGLTSAVALRGIGNGPGASMMKGEVRTKGPSCSLRRVPERNVAVSVFGSA